jgi:hypothetical protein
MSEEDIDVIQNSQKEKIAEWERKLRDPAYKSDKQQVDDSVKEDDDTANGFEDSSSDLVQSLPKPGQRRQLHKIRRPLKKTQSSRRLRLSQRLQSQKQKRNPKQTQTKTNLY